jgi:hypothetical protein
MARRGPPSGDAAMPELRQVDTGAATSVWAATAPELEGRGGVYLVDCAVSDDWADYARDADAARRLWDLSEELVGV